MYRDVLGIVFEGVSTCRAHENEDNETFGDDDYRTKQHEKGKTTPVLALLLLHGFFCRPAVGSSRRGVSLFPVGCFRSAVGTR